MYDTEEYVLERIHEYSGGLDRLVQLCPETPKETQKRSDQIGDYVDTHKSRNEHKAHCAIENWEGKNPPLKRNPLLDTSMCRLAFIPAALRINLNIDGAPITSRTHTHTSHSQTSRPLTSSLSLGVPVPRATQCMRVV